MKRFKFIACMVIAVAVWSACSDDNATRPELPEPGLPDWSEARYGWIDSINEVCADRSITPKFEVRVMGALEGGSTLLVSCRQHKVFLYDVDARRVSETLLEERVGAAQVAGNQQLVVVMVVHTVTQGRIFYRPHVIDLITKEAWEIPVPASLVGFGAYVQWLPGDTALLLSDAVFPGAPAAFHQVNIYAPFSVRNILLKDASSESFFVTGNDVVYFSEPNKADGGGNVAFKAAPLSNTFDALCRDFEYAWTVGHGSYSPSGTSLALMIGLDLADTRFAHAESIHGLAILDMSIGTPVIATFFPDADHSARHCGEGLDGVAWPPDERFVYHGQMRIADTTTQIVRREIASGATEIISDFTEIP